MKMPCEVIVWDIVPVIKREFAISLVKDQGLNQRKTAEKLETTEAAISRYLSGKRGVLEIRDKEVLSEIRKSAKKISDNENTSIIDEVCNICRLIRSKNINEELNNMS